MLDRMRSRWYELQARERVAVATAAAVVGLAILFLAVIDPIMTTRAALRTEVTALSEDLDFMRAAAARLGPGGSTASDDEGGLLYAVDASAQQFGLRSSVRRLQPEGADGVRVTLDDAAFDAVVLMLGELRDRGVRIERLSLRREPDGVGLVDGSLSLRAGA
jgi:general secretion pathway protein M